jgi:hypothetical protein
MLIVLWVIALALVACAVFLASILGQNARIEQMMKIQLASMSDAHMDAFDAVMTSIKRLENRVAALERKE